MRLPFDFSKAATRAAAPAPSPQAAAASPLSVSELARRIGQAIGSGFQQPIRVAGEVTGFRANTHWYFSIKDADSVIACVMFSTAARTASFQPVDGQQVVLTGRPDFWAKGGRTSFVVSAIQPIGQGALDAAFRALCDELRAMGWFDPARKRPLPRFPRRIAVVTAATGAAIQDVLVTMRRRCPAVEVAVVDVPVQGEGAASEVARAVRWLGSRHRALAIDAIMVTRGGGSREDLWAFNERVVAAAIRESPVPVVAAIGHEVDVTIAELVADERAATPTQAAMKITPDREALLEQLQSTATFLTAATARVVRERGMRRSATLRQLGAAVAARAGHAARRLDRAAAALERQRPAAVYERRAAATGALSRRLVEAARRLLESRRTDPLASRLEKAWAARAAERARRVDALERQLAAVGPLAVLKRGFSVTIREDGHVVRSPREVTDGERLRTRLADGVVESTVTGQSGHAAPRRRSRPAGPKEGPAMDLFSDPP